MEDKKGIIQGFKTFIMRGNAIDLAVGMIIGAAFSGVVTALVDKVIMPLVAAVFGSPNFDDALTIEINGSPIVIGALITALVNFLLVAFALYFCLIMPMNMLKDKAEARRKAKEGEKEEAPEADPADVALLKEIRDLLQKS